MSKSLKSHPNCLTVCMKCRILFPGKNILSIYLSAESPIACYVLTRCVFIVFDKQKKLIEQGELTVNGKGVSIEYVIKKNDFIEHRSHR